MPGVRALRTYERSWLSRDLIAGIVLVTLLVPQGMAHAELAGLPAITGLYTTVICLVAYALVGPSPILVLGPDSSLGPTAGVANSREARAQSCSFPATKVRLWRAGSVIRAGSIS
jgi:MFS superfamily sulfate permease-like transporter